MRPYLKTCLFVFSLLDYFERWSSATILQSLFRGWKARKYARQKRIHTISVWLATRILLLWRRKKAVDILNDLQLEKQRQWIAAVRIIDEKAIFKIIYLSWTANATGPHTEHMAKTFGQWPCSSEEIRILRTSQDIKSNMWAAPPRLLITIDGSITERENVPFTVFRQIFKAYAVVILPDRQRTAW